MYQSTKVIRHCIQRRFTPNRTSLFAENSNTISLNFALHISHNKNIDRLSKAWYNFYRTTKRFGYGYKQQYERFEKSGQNDADYMVLHHRHRNRVSCIRHKFTLGGRSVRRQCERGTSSPRRRNRNDGYRCVFRYDYVLLDVLLVRRARNGQTFTQNQRRNSRRKQRKHSECRTHGERSKQSRACAKRRRNRILPSMRQENRKRFRILQVLRHKTIIPYKNAILQNQTRSNAFEPQIIV